MAPSRRVRANHCGDRLCQLDWPKAATALRRMVMPGLVGEKMLQRSADKGGDAAAIYVGVLKSPGGKEMGHEALRQILRVFHAVTLVPDAAVDRGPVDRAKLGECSRSGVAVRPGSIQQEPVSLNEDSAGAWSSLVGIHAEECIWATLIMASATASSVKCRRNAWLRSTGAAGSVSASAASLRPVIDCGMPFHSP